MKKILLIDNDIFSGNIAEYLEEFDYKTILAEDARKGIKIAKEVLPDIIICNVEQSDMDGYTVLMELSKQIETAAIPFILTSFLKTSKEDIRYAMNLGADDYLIKPFDPSELIRAIEARLLKFDKVAKKNDVKFKKNGNKISAKKRLTEDDHLFLMVGNHPEIIKINSIIFIKAAEEYSKVHCLQGKNLLIQKLLKDWERILPEKMFLRIHRSTIINLNYIKKIEKWFNHSFRVYMNDNYQPLIISRRYSSKLRAILR